METTQMNNQIGNTQEWAATSNEVKLQKIVLANMLWDSLSINFVSEVSSFSYRYSDEIEKLVPLCNPYFVYTLALDARFKQKLRHAPLYLAVEMCKHDATKIYVADVLQKVCTRPDMITDFLKFYWESNTSKKICNQAKKGLAKAFANFDEYQFGKYKNGSDTITLRDAMFLTRPKPLTAEQEELYKKIADNKLAVPETWEVMLSNANTAGDKKTVWEYLIYQKKLGALATLRNIRNMEKYNVSDDFIKTAILNISGKNLLPMNFYTSYKINPNYKTEIYEAFKKSYEDVSKLSGNTLVILDISGSMCSRISSKGITRMEAVEAMASLTANKCHNPVFVCTAGDDYKHKHESAEFDYKNPKYKNDYFAAFSEIATLRKSLGGGGIFTRQCLEWCEKQYPDMVFDRIIAFTDSEDCDYRDKRESHPFGKYNYICNISANRNSINYNGVWDAEISGFSENFLNFIEEYEKLNLK